MNTRQDTPNATRVRGNWVRNALLAALPVVLFGCGTSAPSTPEPNPQSAVGTNSPAWVTNRPKLPPPDADRMTYDEQSRTLTLYTLPGNDRWMVQLPGEVAGRPVPATHRIPKDAEISKVMVYYARPGLKPSMPVSVQQIRDTGNAHSSLATLR